jgi:hypothetical protein
LLSYAQVFDFDQVKIVSRTYTSRVKHYLCIGRLGMNFDFVVVLSLAIVTLTCVFLVYVSYYAYKHIKQDIAKNESKSLLL